MKKLILILLSSLTFIVNAQVKKEISLDNSLSGILSQNKSGNQININFTGNNSFDYGKHIALDLGTNYQVGYSPEISQNEFIQKANLGYNKEHWDLFTTYQFNYSLLRSIKSDNWIGAGGGIKESFGWGKASLSYAFLYQNTDFINLDNKVTYRHSIRGKIKIEKKSFTLSTEYYYQPSVNDFKDYIVLGTTKIVLFPNKPLNFIIQETLNYRSISDFKMIQNTTFGIGYKFNKKF